MSCGSIDFFELRERSERSRESAGESAGGNATHTLDAGGPVIYPRDDVWEPPRSERAASDLPPWSVLLVAEGARGLLEGEGVRRRRERRGRRACRKSAWRRELRPGRFVQPVRSMVKFVILRGEALRGLHRLQRRQTRRRAPGWSAWSVRRDRSPWSDRRSARCPPWWVAAILFVAPCRKLGGERVKLRGASHGVPYSGTAHVWRRGGTA